jgi:hypothetical protein
VTRQELVAEIAKLVGPSIVVDEPGDGWPALVTMTTASGDFDVALFAGSVGLSSRGRDDVERRFQNPGQNRPIEVPPGRFPLLVGLWDEDPLLQVVHPVLVAADAWKREGLMTRYSVFAKLDELLNAVEIGWTEAENTSGEVIRCLHPALLPVYLEALVNDVELPEETIQVAVQAAGIPDLTPLPDDERAPLEEAAAERVRRATSALVRDARFSRDVLAAYGGRCALCGLASPLVEGAHIYPASAPGSPDDIQNGVALCNNHHAAFDRHLIWIDPASRAVRCHPNIVTDAEVSAGAHAFVSSTDTHLGEPANLADRPVDVMFQNRYDYFAGLYDWVDQL